MKHDMHLSDLDRAATPVVAVLQCPCTLQLDPTPLAAIFADKGEDVASETVCHALENIAKRLNKLVMQHGNARFMDLITPAMRIAAMADQIGLIEVAQSARNVADCAAQKDGVALEATLARLERSFDIAIGQVWNFHDLI